MVTGKFGYDVTPGTQHVRPLSVSYLGGYTFSHVGKLFTEKGEVNNTWYAQYRQYNECDS